MAKLHSSENQKAIEDKLLQEKILSQSPALIAVYNIRSGEYIYISDSIKSLLGYAKSRLLEGGLVFVSSLIHPDDLPRILAENESALQKVKNKQHKNHPDDIVVTFEYRIRHKNGTWRWLRTDGKVIDYDEKGDVLHVMNVSLDITARKEAEISEDKNRKQARHRAALLEKVSKMMMKSLDHQVTLEEIVQMLVPDMADYCRVALIDKRKEIKELAINHKDPDKVTLTKALFDGYIGNPKALYGVKKILQSGKPEVITYVDEKTLEPVKNDPSMLKIIQSLNLQSYMGVPLTVRGKVIGAMTLSSANRNNRYTHEDLVFAEELARRIALMLDNARLYQDALAEIEKRKEIEIMLREREAQYKRLLDLSPMPIAIHAEGKVVYVNNAAVKLIGANSMKDIVGKGVLQFVHPDYHELVKKRVEAIYKEKRKNTDIVEEKFLSLSGETLHVEVASLLFHYEGKPSIQVVMRDVSQQKLAEEELRAREERFRLLVQNSSDIITIFDPSGTILYQSSSVKKILGYEPRLGTNIYTDPLVHPDDLKKRIAMLERSMHYPKELVKAEFRFLHKNGSWRTLEAVCQNFINDPRIGGIVANYRDITERKTIEEIIESERQKVMAVLESTNEGIYGTDADGRCIFINPALLQLLGYKEKECLGKNVHELLHYKHLDGSAFPIAECPIYLAMQNGTPARLLEEVLWTKSGEPIQVLVSCSPIIEGDEITGSVIAVIDIRERKQMERQKDEFIGIVSHELKTPVTSIKAYTQVLEHRFEKAGDIKSAALLAKMDTQLDKLTNLIKDLLDITKIESGKLLFKEEMFDFNELVNEIVEEMQRTTEKHKIIKELGKSRKVYGDRDRIGQVLINYISNAIKYSPAADKVIVKATAGSKYITISVRDFGVGIASENQKKVFERFFRGNEKEQASYPGLGLGLYISSEIIKRHRGKVWLESAKGKGSTFSFSLPTSRNS